MGISKVIDDYDTIIVDSLTNAQHMAVMHAVTVVKGASIERPSLQGYGHRNALITQLVKNLLRLTAKHDKHVIFIAHEGHRRPMMMALYCDHSCTRWSATNCCTC